MKAGALLVLIALAVLIVAPVTVTLSPVSRGTVIIAMDICNTVNPALSSNFSMPWIHECQHTILPAGFVGFNHLADVTFRTLLIAEQEEHPPRI
jgi:hypothetical protein